MNVHFVCRGNVYRSRLAEAYANSLHIPNMVFSSSGVEVDEYYPVQKYPISYIEPWTEKVAERNSLNMSILSPVRKQTTNEVLHNKDIIIAMKDDVYEILIARYDVNTSICRYWDIEDITDIHNVDVEICYQTFKNIKESVDSTFLA